MKTRLTERDITRIVRKVTTENNTRLNEGAYGSFINVYDKLASASKGNVGSELIRPVAMWLHDNCDDMDDMNMIMRFISIAVSNAEKGNSTEEEY
jgi:hypothetical protein